MNIAFVTLGFRPFRSSGLDVSGERLVDGLINRGHNVTVIAGCERNSGIPIYGEEEKNLRVFRVPIGKSDWVGYSLRTRFVLHELFRRETFDILHFWDIHFAFACSIEFIGSLHQSFRQRNAYLNIDYYSNQLSRLRYRLYYYFARYCFEIPTIKRARLLLAVSQTTKKEFENHYRIPSSKILLARHGIDVHFFRKYSSEALALRSQLGIGKNDPVLLFAGFITPRKNIETLFRAISLMPVQPLLVIVGKWRDDKYRQKVLEGFPKQRIIEVGYVKDELMPVYYSMADVFVLPSLLEGFGLPLVEALACETPVVATRSGSIPEVVGPGGFIVDPLDYVAMANCITYLVTDRALRQRIAEYGRVYVEHNFSVDKFISSILEGYKYALR